MVHMTRVKTRYSNPNLSVMPGADGDVARPRTFPNVRRRPMRARPITVLAAMAAVTLVIAGCDEAIVEAKVPAKVSSKPVHGAPDRPAQPAAAGRTAARRRHDARATAGSAGLRVRWTAGAHPAGDRRSRRQRGHPVGSHPRPQDPSAGLQRQYPDRRHRIGGQALHRRRSAAGRIRGQDHLSPDDRQALDVMLQSSDDGAAEKFWGQGGGDAIITRSRAGTD